jgi:hypothetical protein
MTGEGRLFQEPGVRTRPLVQVCLSLTGAVLKSNKRTSGRMLRIIKGAARGRSLVSTCGHSGAAGL